MTRVVGSGTVASWRVGAALREWGVATLGVAFESPCVGERGKLVTLPCGCKRHNSPVGTPLIGSGSGSGASRGVMTCLFGICSRRRP